MVRQLSVLVKKARTLDPIPNLASAAKPLDT